MDGTVSRLIFISYSSQDITFAREVDSILTVAGFNTIRQERDFGTKNFMGAIDDALASGARVVALYSPDYFKSDYCRAEALGALTGDPLNKNQRLIPLRISECSPPGLLANIAYMDLLPVRNMGNDDLLKATILDCLGPDAKQLAGPGKDYWQKPQTILHSDIQPTDNFTGRDSALEQLDRALWADDITVAIAATGLGGIGKSTLAREYAWQNRDKFAGIWWLNAERSKGADGWEGVEHGLVELGSQFITDLDQMQDRNAAAQLTLQFLETAGFEKPWLIIFDNVDDMKVLSEWPVRGDQKTLITTRLDNWGTKAKAVEIKEWPPEEAKAYLLREADRDDLTDAQAEQIAKALGGLPLALSHAAAYLRDNTVSTAESYLADISRHMAKAPADVDYDRAVYATFKQQIEQAETRTQGAAAVLSLASFFAPNDIPEELFAQPVEAYPEILHNIVSNSASRNEAIGALDKLSLIDFSPATRTFSVHRLVQSAARDALGEARDEWAKYAGDTAFAAFPEPEYSTWEQCERLIAHVRSVLRYISVQQSGREIGWLYSAAGEYLQERAAINDVLPLFQASLAICERLADSDPGNAGWQRNLSVSQDNIGVVLSAQGNLGQALEAFQASLAIRERLADSDPGNAGWQRNLSVSHNKIGDVLRAQGNLGQALEAFQASLAICERLADSDPGNAGWQRDLSVSQEKIGDVLREQGNLGQALEAYQESLDIMLPLIEADPGNAGWQRHISVSHNKIGDVLRAQGNLGQALEAYQESLKLIIPLIEIDPGNITWQRHIAISYANIASVEVQQGKRDSALQGFQRGCEIIQRLCELSPDNAQLPQDLAWFQARIAELQGGVVAEDTSED